MTYLLGSHASRPAAVPTDWEMLCQQDLCSGHVRVVRTQQKAGRADIRGMLGN